MWVRQAGRGGGQPGATGGPTPGAQPGPGLPLPPGFPQDFMMGGGTAQFAMGGTPVRISHNSTQGVSACTEFGSGKGAASLAPCYKTFGYAWLVG